MAVAVVGETGSPLMMVVVVMLGEASSPLMFVVVDIVMVILSVGRCCWMMLMEKRIKRSRKGHFIGNSDELVRHDVQ